MNLMKRLFIFLFLGVFIVLFLCFGLLKGYYLSTQPIKFSHKIHAGKYEISCLYCHTYANRSPYAGIPSVQRCIGCHKVIGLNRPEVKKIHEYWSKKKSIPWIRIYNIPDFVYFTHRRHVNSGVKCKTCHGEVEKMDIIKRFTSLKMGWCLKCHKKNNVSIDCIVCHK
jgi:hypothetical protein